MHHVVGSEKRSHYSGSLRAGRLWARTRVGKRFQIPTQTGPGLRMAFGTIGTGSAREGKRPSSGVEQPLHCHPPCFDGILEGQLFLLVVHYSCRL
jgi:hypothetical protein